MDAKEGPDVRNLGVQSRALTGRFKELLIESQEAQNEIRGKMKDKIVRQVKILDVSMTQQEAEGIAEDPNVYIHPACIKRAFLGLSRTSNEKNSWPATHETSTYCRRY